MCIGTIYVYAYMYEILIVESQSQNYTSIVNIFFLIGKTVFFSLTAIYLFG